MERLTIRNGDGTVSQPMKKIYWPCDSCVYEGKCDYHRGCYRWKKWFRAYWKGLRRQVLGEEY